MTIQELIKRMRIEFLDDLLEPPFWPSSNIISSLSQAERELCRRLYLLHDSTTAAICQIPIAATGGIFPRSYAIDNRILRIDRLKYPGITKPLTQTTTAQLDQFDSGWDEATGTPTKYVVDTDDFTITFDRQPTTAGTVNMQVKRLPLIPLLSRALTDSPELKQLDYEMIHGALKYLYIRPDAETFNIDLSKKWDNQFETDIQHIIQNRAAMNPQTWVCRPERF